MSGIGRPTTLPLGAVRTDSGDVVVPESRRADGSVRKTIRIRQGYVPQDEVPKYKPVGQRMREQQARQPSADADTLTSGLRTLSLGSTKEKQEEKLRTTNGRDSREQSRRRAQSPPAARASNPLPTPGASSSARDAKTELSSVNKSLREIAKLEEFAAAAARGDDGARPLTAAQQKKTELKTQLEKRRQELVALLDNGENPQSVSRSAPPPAKPRTLRVVEL